jgi:colanic acid biosynthesis glycosyl transferase WcaI
MSSLKLLVYSLNYTPELTGIGKYNTEMCEWLAQHGHTVKVLTAQPYYPDWKVFAGYKAWQYSQQTINGVSVLRCPLWVPKKPNGLKRILHLLSFACSSLPRLLMLKGFKPDIILFIEPSIFCFPNALLASRFLRAKPVLHVQDFEIDVAFNLGMMKSSFLQKCLFSLEAYVYKRCALVSSITPKMRQKLLEKAVAENKAVLFPNWADIESIKPLAHISPLRAELNISDDSIVILYSGNLGAKQGLEIIIEAAKALQSKPNILFLICGTGPYLQNLKQMAQDYQLSNILWLPLQPLEKLNDLLNLADIHLLPQKPDVKDQVMPSKLLGMLASGRAIVATALPGTQLYQVMEQTGVVSPPGDVLELVRNLEKLAQDQALRSNLGEKARAYAEQHFSKQHILSCYESQLLNLIKPEGQ